MSIYAWNFACGRIFCATVCVCAYEHACMLWPAVAHSVRVCLCFVFEFNREPTPSLASSSCTPSISRIRCCRGVCVVWLQSNRCTTQTHTTRHAVCWVLQCIWLFFTAVSIETQNSVKTNISATTDWKAYDYYPTSAPSVGVFRK